LLPCSNFKAPHPHKNQKEMSLSFFRERFSWEAALAFSMLAALLLGATCTINPQPTIDAEKNGFLQNILVIIKRYFHPSNF
jgi:hypothetical protein